MMYEYCDCIFVMKFEYICIQTKVRRWKFMWIKSEWSKWMRNEFWLMLFEVLKVDQSKIYKFEKLKFQTVKECE